MKLETEFEIRKLEITANQHGYKLIEEPSLSLPTFQVLDEYLDDFKVATIQWTGDRWACIGLAPQSVRFCPVLVEASAPHFWEIHY